GPWGPPVPRQLGPYARGRLIGRGGMGAVYEAIDTRLHRAIALKVARLGDDAALREARHAAAVEHPNVARVYDVGETDGFTWVAMERVHGAPLSQLTISKPNARAIAIQLTRAVAAAHAKGVVHRDLKPANVMVTGDLEVKVLDFGLARLGGDAGERAGTEGFSAPEQTRGAPADARADVYSLGRIFEALGLGDDLTFRAVIARCTAPEPAARPASAGAVLEELQRAQQRRTTTLSIAVGLALAALTGGLLLVPRAPSGRVLEKSRVFASATAPYRAVAAARDGAYVAATSTQLEWVQPGGARTVEPWPHGRVVDVAWGASSEAWVVSTEGVFRAAQGQPAKHLTAERFLHVKPSHDGAFVVAATEGALFTLSARGELVHRLDAGALGDFDVSPDGAQVGFISFAGQSLPQAELFVFDLATGERRHIGVAELGLEGGRSGFAWPRAGTWVTARAGPVATLRASSAGRLEPSTSLGDLPLSAISSLDARGDHVFFLQTVLQSDVYLAVLDGGVTRLTDTPTNERISAFIGGEPLGISDAFGGWALARFVTDGGAPQRLSPPGLVWPAVGRDGGLWAFELEPTPRGSRPGLVAPSGRRVRELPEVTGTFVPPPPFDARVRCHARGCTLATAENGHIRLEGLDYPLSVETEPTAEGVLGLSISPSGRWLALSARARGVVWVDLDDGARTTRATEKRCAVHAVSVDDARDTIAAEECDGEGQLVRYAGDARSVLLESPFIVTSPERDGDRLAYIVKHERCEGWSWRIGW
ncbi:MAG: serine/threonine-protein kinase, partial [Myxococcaceae bacterium]|nr:serine/threonine-protein kinase [Myxococcaceae bacterium]